MGSITALCSEGSPFKSGTQEQLSLLVFISCSKYKNTAFNLPMPASFYVLTNSLLFPFYTTFSEPHRVLNRQKFQPRTCFICVFLNCTGSYPEGHVIFNGFCQDFQCVLFFLFPIIATLSFKHSSYILICYKKLSQFNIQTFQKYLLSFVKGIIFQVQANQMRIDEGKCSAECPMYPLDRSMGGSKRKYPPSWPQRLHIKQFFISNKNKHLSFKYG